MNIKKIFTLFLILLAGFILGVGFSNKILPIFNKEIDIDDIFGKKLIEVDGIRFTSTSLPKESIYDYYNLKNNIYHAEKNFLNQTALRIALTNDFNKKNAKQEDFLTLKDLIKLDYIDDKIVKNYYDDILKKEGVGVFQGKTFENLKIQLKNQLINQKMIEISEKKITELLKNNRIKILIPDLENPPLNIDISSFPSSGKKQSEITLLNIYDYNELKSKEKEEKFEKIFKKYGDKVNFVSIHYSSNNNKMNEILINGAYCAQKQGTTSFLKYNKMIFQLSLWKEKNLSNIKDIKNKVIEIAKSSNLNSEIFQSCLDSQKTLIENQLIQHQLSNSFIIKNSPNFYINKNSKLYSQEEIEQALRRTVH
ncbi:thioredoxin domain-containing protein [Silvanigrella paludirubra]|uniref:Thioredoxin domain-containing protein n=1 Tax=Silvanigrella paludirubra TaxID=2499159 RepID=A0A6N6VXE0_9BACT|nr:thioredoxin domain-containing protein [Silvanigrella paludirubra]KAB8040679.1 thioredoxin domain-containing protein [Silvanigrella paludirubra]